MTTINTAAVSNNYPFVTKAQLAGRIATDDDFVKECLVIMYRRQTTDEQEEKDTKYRNKRGFMSSHAVRGTELALKVVADEWINPEEMELARSIVKSYTKQLAGHFRTQTLAERPELADQAKVFGL